MKLIIAIVLISSTVFLFFLNCAELTSDSFDKIEETSASSYNEIVCGTASQSQFGGSTMRLSNQSTGYTVTSDETVFEYIIASYQSQNSNQFGLPTSNSICAYSNTQPRSTIEGKDFNPEAIYFLKNPPVQEKISLNKLSPYSFCGQVRYTGLGGCALSLSTHDERHCLDSRFPRLRLTLEFLARETSNLQLCLHGDEAPVSSFEGSLFYFSGVSINK